MIMSKRQEQTSKFVEICCAKFARALRSRNSLLDVNNKFPNISINFHKFQIFVLCFIFLFLSGCATVYNPATEQGEIIFINSLQEVQIGRSMAENIIRKKYAPLNDPVRQRLVNSVGQRIVQASDRRDIVYHFQVLDSVDLNAFALPGGYIFIYRGLLERVDETALAAILAHEVAHVAAKHAVKRMQAALGVDVLLGIALAGLGDKNAAFAQQVAQVSGVVYELLSLGYSRQDEFLADKLAVKYLRAAPFDPYGMVRALEILNKEKGPGGRVFETLSTHPRMEERIKRVKEEIKASESSPPS